MRFRCLTLAAVLVVSLCPPALAAPAAPRIVFDPAAWDYGMIMQGTVAKATVTVTNSEPAPVTVTFVPTCTCLQVAPASLLIPPGSRGAFSLTFDSRDDVGKTTRGYIVRTDNKGAADLYYSLSGVVRTENAAAPAWTAPNAPAAPPASAGAAARVTVTLDYYYTPGCRSCEEFLSATLPGIAAARGVAVDVRRRDILQPAVFQELTALAAAAGRPLQAVPALHIGGTLLQGDKEILSALPGLLAAAAAEGTRTAPAASVQSGSGAASSVPVAALPVLAAGLIDGINPCAFTTLIFLLASLVLGGRGRREVLLIGALFSFSVFVTYLLVGLGFFAALRAAGVVPLVSAILRWILAAALVVFAALSFYDYTLVRRGRAAGMLLQLPGFLKKRIHSSIRTRARGDRPAGSSGLRAAALAGSSLVLGFLVSIFEFACTGQVYLPTLAYLARMEGRADALGLLALYNVAFIVPLLVVFAASYAGTGQARIVALFQAHMGKVKIALGVVFAALAVVTLVG